MADKKISGTHRPHRLTSQEHYSDAFLTSAFLALSGGLQDAYTYNTRDGVFSNAQTGNVVLMSQHLMPRGMGGMYAVFRAGHCVCAWRLFSRANLPPL